MSKSPFRVLSILHQASREVGLHVDDLLRDLELSGQEGQLLAFVEARDGAPVMDLVNLLGTPKSTMTSILNRLEDRGLVQRLPSPDDGRARLVHTSPAGQKLAREAKKRVLELDRRLADKIGEDDAAALRRIREAIADATGVDLAIRVSPPR